LVIAVAAVALLGGCVVWAAQLPPPPPPFVSDDAKAEAVGLLGAATAMEQDGQLGLALDLARQAQAKDPTNPEAGAFLKTVAPQATAAAKAAAAQATAAAQAAAAQEQARRDALRAYGRQVAPITDRYTAANSRMARLLLDAGDQPLLLRTPSWRADMAVALFALRTAGDDLAAVDPVPPEAQATQALLRQVGSETRQLVDDLARGLDNVDAGAVRSATARMERVGGLFRQATAEAQGLVQLAA
jgi:hypothetical protein